MSTSSERREKEFQRDLVLEVKDKIERARIKEGLREQNALFGDVAAWLETAGINPFDLRDYLEGLPR